MQPYLEDAEVLDGEATIVELALFEGSLAGLSFNRFLRQHEASIAEGASLAVWMRPVIARLWSTNGLEDHSFRRPSRKPECG